MRAPVEALLAEIAADLLADDLATNEETWTDLDRARYDQLHTEHGDNYDAWPIPALREALSILCRVTGRPDAHAPPAPPPRVVSSCVDPPDVPAPVDPLAYLQERIAPTERAPAPPVLPPPATGPVLRDGFEFLEHLKWALGR